MSSNPISFALNEQQFAETLGYLHALAAAGPRVVASELNKAVMIWQREIRRHTPVDMGLLRNSWDVALANTDQGGRLEAEVGTNVPYAPFIEFGNPWIAGGQLRDWEVGDQPILDWPAKRRDASDETTLSIDERGGAAGKGRNAKGQFTSAAAASGAEWLPPMRGSWPVVAPTIVARLRSRLAKLMRDGKVSS